MKRLLTSLIIICAMNVFAAPQAEANDFGIRVSPIVLLFGAVDASLDIALGSIVISPEVLYWNLKLSDVSWKVQGYGASVSYHFSGALNDSWYLGALAKQISVTVEDTSETGTLDTTFVGGRVGYVWVWSSFYMNLGGTFGSLADNELTITNNNTSISRTESVPLSGLGVGLEFKLGFSF